jgi:hypothetical protein
MTAPSGLTLTLTSLAEIGSAVALGYAHYFADVMAATLLWVVMECAWERITGRRLLADGLTDVAHLPSAARSTRTHR